MNLLETYIFTPLIYLPQFSRSKACCTVMESCYPYVKCMICVNNLSTSLTIPEKAARPFYISIVSSYTRAYIVFSYVKVLKKKKRSSLTCLSIL